MIDTPKIVTEHELTEYSNVDELQSIKMMHKNEVTVMENDSCLTN